jgi:DNA-binding CsgD family transcriptional regulator
MLERCLVSLMENNKDLALRIQTAQRSLAEHPPSPAQMAVFETELRFYRAAAHYAGGEIELAAQWVEQLQGERRHLDPLLMGALDFLQMRLSAASADEAIQRQHARRALAAFKAVDFVAGQIAVRRELAMMDVRAGRSAEAGREFERIVAAFGGDPAILRGELAWVHLYAAEHSYWQNDLERALHHIEAGQGIASIFQEADVNSHLAYLHRLYAVKGHGCDAIREPDPPAGKTAPQSHLADRQVRWLLAVERTEEAWEAARDHQASLADDLMNLPYTHSIPYLRAYVARGVDLADVRPLLKCALDDSVKARDLPKQLELLAFSAWLELQMGQAAAARAALAQVEALVAKTGYVRVLLDIPPLAALWEAEQQPDGQTSAAVAVEASSLLTAQEQAVLTLLAEDLTYEQIAQALTVSINTVRTHVKNIYRKLAVRRRDQAIQRAQELGLGR